jgi:hypothetical protein
LEVLVHRAGNFNLEWGFLAPAPSFLRTVRLVVVATTIGATTSAAAVFALMRQPAAEESIAARTLVRSVSKAPPTDRAPVAAQIQTERAVGPGTSAGSETAAIALAEAPGMVAEAPAAREASEISVSPAREGAPSLKPPSKKPRLTSLEEHRVVAGRYANRPAPPSAGDAHNSAFRHDKSNVVRHDESVVGRTIRVTGDIVAATQRAIFAVAVIP